MSLKAIQGLILNRSEVSSFWMIFLSALTLRWLLLLLGFTDYWGDAQHNLIISKLTLDNDFVYTDFKDRALTWLPLYRYVGSIVMGITGTYSLLVLNITNTFIGAFAASLAYKTAADLMDHKSGLLAGLIVAVLPYLMVFSYISMGEMLGGLLLLGWFFSIYREKFWIAAICAFLASLTRYELTFLIGMAMLPFFYFKNYKAVIYSIGGLIAGIGLWSWWSYTNSGNPLTWLLMRIESTTRSNSFYLEEANRFHRNLIVPIATVLQAFPLVIFFIWLKKPHHEPDKVQSWFFVAGYITVIHWIFFFLAQLKIMAYPDPRFFIISLPITIIWFVGLMKYGYLKAFVKEKTVILVVLISCVQLIVPYYRQFSLQPRKEAGLWIAENLKDEDMIWSDQAVAIVESGKEPADFISSDKLIPLNQRNSDARQSEWLVTMLESLEINYFTSYNAPFDYTQAIWPQIRNLEPFEWENYTFVPVYIYKPFKRESASLHEYLREQFEAPLSNGTVWKIYRN